MAIMGPSGGFHCFRPYGHHGTPEGFIASGRMAIMGLRRVSLLQAAWPSWDPPDLPVLCSPCGQTIISNVAYFPRRRNIFFSTILPSPYPSGLTASLPPSACPRDVLQSPAARRFRDPAADTEGSSPLYHCSELIFFIVIRKFSAIIVPMM